MKNRKLEYSNHIERLLSCRKCSNMQGNPVHGCVPSSKIISLGQAPGIHEERFGRPFAYTAGKTLLVGLKKLKSKRKIFEVR
ncbi:uracil-DNA glycosylase domain protein [Leptospira interrogans serovar Bataviae str. HAI135]|nr:uracil-DNA glycosylase domain protein [Leptospira interrogans serovar Bataviae str. HAI135]